MAILDRLWRKKPGAQGRFAIATDNKELRVFVEPPAGAGVIVSPYLAGFLEQVEEEGFAVRTADGYLFEWEALYRLLAHPAYADAGDLLVLPKTRQPEPELSSQGSLEDHDFRIAIGDWRLDGQTLRDTNLAGGILRYAQGEVLLTENLWRLTDAVRQFAGRSREEQNGAANRQSWGRIRSLAIAAGVRLDDFLRRTVVLTPEKLSIGIRKAELGDDKVIEVQPGFDGAPEDWLRVFDRSSKVPDRYDLLTEDGIVQVIVTPKVRTVLEEIKRFPYRRVAGKRAQAFILNPYASLGEDASDVIDERQFEEARSSAGLGYERFTAQFERNALRYPLKVGLLIETYSQTRGVSSETRWLNDEELGDFVRSLGRALDGGSPLLGWQGYDLELQGDALDELARLTQALNDRHSPPILISYADIYDLSHYGSRVHEIGIEKPYFSPYIAKKSGEIGWFPDNIVAVIGWTPEGEIEPLALPLSDDGVTNLRKKIADAETSGSPDIRIPGCPKPLPIGEAKRILEAFDTVGEVVQKSEFDPSAAPKDKTSGSTAKKSPVIRANIQSVDYSEERRDALSSLAGDLVLPRTLRPEVSLLPHQCAGVAWLQRLYSARASYACRGAILADDMGLGKTLQLLTFMAAILEREPSCDPMLVVAPVSLLENWKEEAVKFFSEGALPMLTAYGDDLKFLRVPRESIDERLRNEDGLVKFLVPNWIGTAKIVLTTYETLRDLEFSFATQRWSVLVCDEAQKIKNPSAMVTRSAKKQNVAFKIACTGTPVENSLADIWCLFDFIQPGLLGALNEFSRRYRRPIEAKTEEERAKVEELRQLIAPQILRRLKGDVAKDLPQKIEAEGCRKLPISPRQRELYISALSSFRMRNEQEVRSAFKNHLGLLHYLRLICTDPSERGLDTFRPLPLIEYRQHAPKISWLLAELDSIRKIEEKAIIFCEFRNIQRLLQYYINEVFGLVPDIINGDTSASVYHSDSRQKRIRAFQDRSGFGVIILSPVAVGFGVNIQAANHVIHYTRTWNPAKEDQATDRAYRIGQTKDVRVYYPIVHAEDFVTFDVKLDALLSSKRALAEDMLNGAGDVIAADFGLDG
jgi:hypothetical protein